MSNDKLAEARTRIKDWIGCVAADGSVSGAACMSIDEIFNALQAHAPEAAHPQPAQDAKDAAMPLKGWIFDKVDMGRGDERYISTPDGSNATTVRNETTSDHRERMLWMIADAMAKESGR